MAEDKEHSGLRGSMAMSVESVSTLLHPVPNEHDESLTRFSSATRRQALPGLFVLAGFYSCLLAWGSLLRRKRA